MREMVCLRLDCSAQMVHSESVHSAVPLTPEETVQLHEGKQLKALEHALHVQYVKEVRRQLAECYKVGKFV